MRRCKAKAICACLRISGDYIWLKVMCILKAEIGLYAAYIGIEAEIGKPRTSRKANATATGWQIQSLFNVGLTCLGKRQNRTWSGRLGDRIRIIYRLIGLNCERRDDAILRQRSAAGLCLRPRIYGPLAIIRAFKAGESDSVSCCIADAGNRDPMPLVNNCRAGYSPVYLGFNGVSAIVILIVLRYQLIVR